MNKLSFSNELCYLYYQGLPSDPETVVNGGLSNVFYRTKLKTLIYKYKIAQQHWSNLAARTSQSTHAEQTALHIYVYTCYICVSE